MAIQFYIGEDKREWFRFEVSALQVSEGHVDADVIKENAVAYEKFKASLAEPSVPEAPPSESSDSSSQPDSSERSQEDKPEDVSA